MAVDAPKKTPARPGGKPPAGKKGAGAGLKKKVGPLPLWAWVAIAAGAAVAFIYYRRRGSSSAADTTAGGPSVVTGASGASPLDAAQSGAPSSNGSPADMLSPDVLSSLQDQIQQNLGSQLGDIRGHVTSLEDAFSQFSGASYSGGTGWTGIGAGAPPPDQGGGAPGQPGGGAGLDMSSLGVLWGGNIYRTKAGIAAELGTHGVSYSKWAAQHPSAAARLTGPVPIARPKTAARPAPKPAPKKAPPKAKAPAKKTPPAAKHPPAKPKAPARKAPARPAARR